MCSYYKSVLDHSCMTHMSESVFLNYDLVDVFTQCPQINAMLMRAILGNTTSGED